MQYKAIFADQNVLVEKTLTQYNAVVTRCQEIFLKKTQDYGTAWRILRPSSLTDQLFIKAKRIRSIDEKSTQMVEDSIEGDFIGLVNYAYMALIQLELPADAELELQPDQVRGLYEKEVGNVRNLMVAKNHDYGEAWRDMRISSITDLILMKILRIRQIEDNKGKTLISEGLDANYADIANYAIFALILLSEQN
jgi:Nucleotide modification associated domain 1